MLVNEDFFDYMFPSKNTILHKPNINYDSNNIIFRNFLIFAYQGSGKSSTVNTIAGEAVRRYGQKNVNARISESGDMGALMRWGLRPVLVNILFADNATLRKQDKETLMNYFRIRHLFKERYGVSNGYILSIISVHRFFSVPIELRTNISGILFKDTSLNAYDKNVIKKFIGLDSLHFLEEISKERDKKPELKNFSVFVGRNGFSGLVSLPLGDRNYLKPVFNMTEIMKELGRR